LTPEVSSVPSESGYSANEKSTKKKHNNEKLEIGTFVPVYATKVHRGKMWFLSLSETEGAVWWAAPP
jgi:hypothetical protein